MIIAQTGAGLPFVSWVAIAPELVMAVGATLLLLVDVQWKPATRVLGWLTGVILAVSFGLALHQKRALAVLLSERSAPDFIERFAPFGGMIVFDPGSVMARFVIIAVTALGVAAGWRLFVALGRRGAEALALVLLSAAGFSLMAASLHLMMMFLGLEIGSISLYILAGITRERAESEEAAIKYFLLGSVASAVFVYGVALLFAGTGRLNLGEFPGYFGSIIITRPAVILIALALMLVGLAFKVSAAPFHSWAPDVYQGAPAGIVGYMAAVAKVGGFAGLIRILLTAFPSFATDWRPLVAGMAALSMVVGSLAAVAQTDVRRMLAYSGVAHAGFIMSGLVAGRAGAGVIWFYLAVYTVQLVGAFGVVAAVSGATGARSGLDAYVGLGRSRPYLGVCMAVLLLGMAGLPLTSGFIAKFGVFQEVWFAGYEWLVIVALLASVVAFFFYLRVIVRMFMDSGEAAQEETVPLVSRVAVILTAVATIGLGVFPGPLLDLARNTFPL